MPFDSENKLCNKVNMSLHQIRMWHMMFENSYFGADVSAQILAILSKSHCGEMFYDIVTNERHKKANKADK